MDEYDEIEAAVSFLPGVDLALWFRLAVVLAAATIALALVLTLR
jgi:hypothetical protein